MAVGAAMPAMLAGCLLVSRAAAQGVPPAPQPPPALAATAASSPPAPPAPTPAQRDASPAARRYASVEAAGPPAPIAPPPIPTKREAAYPVLAPLGVVAASTGMLVGFIASSVAIVDGGSRSCADFGCSSSPDIHGPTVIAAIGGGAALIGVGLIIAGATLDGPIVPVAPPRRPPPPAFAGNRQLQVARLF